MKLTIVQTFVSRFLILILSFALVVYSTNMWGSEGRGIIAILIANAAIVGFFSSVFSGSSISYFSSKFKTEQVLLYAYLWSTVIGVIVPLIFALIFRQGEFLMYLIPISILFSLLSTNINLFIGRKDIRRFNLYTILQQAVHILFIAVLVYVIRFEEVTTYFIAQISCYLILFMVSTYQILRKSKRSYFTFSTVLMVAMFSYGWKTQLSAFIQFLNYRLSFYFLEYFEGIATVGIFSIGITFSEAIWTLSRSIAVILYADVVNSTKAEDSITKTKSSLKITLFVTVIFLLIMLLVPVEVYTFIFSKDFYQTKTIILLLSPGIIAIAVSNIIGYYFAGTNRLGILNIKSFVGFLITIGFSFYAIPKWGIVGASVVTTISYCVSSGILFWKFYTITNFRIEDYLISKSEINFYVRKIFKKE